MSLSTYDVCVPTFRQVLGGLSANLDKAAAHCEAGGVDPATWLNARLADDMQPFTFQVMQAVNHSAGTVAKLRGEAFERPSGLDSFAACKAAVDGAIAALDAVTPADLDGTETKDVTFQTPRGDMNFTGQGYLMSFAFPNFFFHATTAYDLLRHLGLPIGKRDFMGAVQLKTAT